MAEDSPTASPLKSSSISKSSAKFSLVVDFFDFFHPKIGIQVCTSDPLSALDEIVKPSGASGGKFAVISKILSSSEKDRREKLSFLREEAQRRYYEKSTSSRSLIQILNFYLSVVGIQSLFTDHSDAPYISELIGALATLLLTKLDEESAELLNELEHIRTNVNALIQRCRLTPVTDFTYCSHFAREFTTSAFQIRDFVKDFKFTKVVSFDKSLSQFIQHAPKILKNRNEQLVATASAISVFVPLFQGVIDKYSYLLLIIFRVFGDFPVEVFGTAKSRIHAWALSNNNKLQVVFRGDEPSNLPIDLPSINNPTSSIIVTTSQHWTELKQIFMGALEEVKTIKERMPKGFPVQIPNISDLNSEAIIVPDPNSFTAIMSAYSDFIGTIRTIVNGWIVGSNAAISLASKMSNFVNPVGSGQAQNSLATAISALKVRGVSTITQTKPNEAPPIRPNLEKADALRKGSDIAKRPKPLPKVPSRKGTLISQPNVASIDSLYNIFGDPVVAPGGAVKLTVGESKITKAMATVKTFVKEALSDSSIVTREINILRKLQSHPRIVTLFDVFETPAEVNVVTEYLVGGDLLEAIASKEIYSEADAAVLSRNILEAVVYMHSKNVVHRFLRPETILLASKDSLDLKVADFAMAIELPSQPPRLLFDPLMEDDYCAPESLGFNSIEMGYGFPVDFYAAGCIIYLLLCGFAPFDRFRGIIELEFPDPMWADVSEEAKDLIRNLLDEDPLKRPTGSALLQNPWVSGSASNRSMSRGIQARASFQLTDKFKMRAKFDQRLTGDSETTASERPGSLYMEELGVDPEWAATSLSSTAADVEGYSKMMDTMGDMYLTFSQI